MNRYGINTITNGVITIECEDLYIDSGSAVFCNWQNSIYGAANRDIVAIWPLSGIESITKQHQFTEEEMLAQIDVKNLQPRINEILAEEYKQQVIAGVENTNESPQ